MYLPARLDHLRVAPLDRPWKRHQPLQVFDFFILILTFIFLIFATVLGAIPASSDTGESEGRQMKQCWITYIKNRILKIHSIESSYPCPGLTFIHCSKSVFCSPSVLHLFSVPRLFQTCSLFPACSKPVICSSPVLCSPSVLNLFSVPRLFQTCSLFPACSKPVHCSPPVPNLFSVPRLFPTWSVVTVPRLFQTCFPFPACSLPVLCSPPSLPVLCSLSVLNLLSVPRLSKTCYLFPACSKPVLFSQSVPNLCSPSVPNLLSVPYLFLVSRPLEHVLQGHDLPLQLVPLPQKTNSLLMFLNVLKIRKNRNTVMWLQIPLPFWCVDPE
jgi:hypothetical protein